MTDNTTQEEMDAAKQEMDQLLHQMVIVPLKGDLAVLLDEALYPLEKGAKELNESVMAQLSKIRRTIDHHYPAQSLPLVEQLQILADAQSNAEIQARSQAERWERQVEAAVQQTLHAVHLQNDTLVVHLGDHLQVLQTQIQNCMKNLEASSVALATKTHIAIAEILVQREQHLKASFAAQTAESKAHYEAVLKTFSAFAVDLTEQRDQIINLQSKLQRSTLYSKLLLCSCLPLGVVSFALLGYLLVRLG